MPKLALFLNEREAKALRRLSEDQLRDPRAQALLILRDGLLQLGYLAPSQIIIEQYQPTRVAIIESEEKDDKSAITG